MRPKTLSIVGDLNTEALRDFIPEFRSATASGRAVTITIHSGGGSVDVGNAMYELLRTANSHITTVGIGEVASMAVLVYMAGDHRILTEGSSLLVHDGSLTLSGELFRVKGMVDESIRSHRWYCEQIAARCKLPLDTVLQLANKESFIPASRAGELGMVDELRTYRPYMSARE